MTRDDRPGDHAADRADDRADDRDPPQGPRQDQPQSVREVPSWVDEVLSAQTLSAQTSPAPRPTEAIPGPTVPTVTVASVDPAATASQASSAPAPADPVPADAAPAAPVSAAPGAGDLRIPEPPQVRPAPAPLTPPARTSADPASTALPQTAQTQTTQTQTTQTTPPLLDSADDWIARATGGTARSPSTPGTSPFENRPFDTRPFSSGPVTHAPVPSRQPDPWAVGHAPAAPAAPAPGDVATKRLIAGLLGILLGAFGAHKLFLGITTPGLLMLAVNIGVWIVALLLGLLTLGFGLVITLPLAGLVSGALALLGLIEGILYLTKSDTDFYQQYVVEKKPWL